MLSLNSLYFTGKIKYFYSCLFILRLFILSFMEVITPNINMSPQTYFMHPTSTCHRQYEALRAFFCEKISADLITKKFGYSINGFYSLIRDFKQKLSQRNDEDPFFQTHKRGAKEKDTEGKITALIVALRKQYLSVPEIKALLDVEKHPVSERYVFSILRKEGFARLPRRDAKAIIQSQAHGKEQMSAPKSEMLSLEPEVFNTQHAGILCLLPYIQKYGLDRIIKESSYPETKTIDKLSSILSFLGLKLSNIRRYSADDLWCMDRGMGLFAKLNALPKAGWFSSYSHRVTRGMNLSFLKKLHAVWKANGVLSDTMNLDFTTIPYWGEDQHLENNWSGKRHTALASMLAVLAQDPDSGIIDYGDTNIRHNKKDDVVLEFLDFYRDNRKDTTLRYLVFDSKFTTQANLRKLEDRGIKFVTIRRRGRNIVNKLEQLPPNRWKKIRVMKADGKGRILKVFEETLTPQDYGKPLRQLAITGHGKSKPALIITNDFNITLEDLIRKYARRWIVEKGISEQIEFFHLNQVSSSMVIKVDFDFTMTILAHNIYRLFASNLSGYAHQTAITLFEKFLCNSGEVEITSKAIYVKLKKKRHLPLLLTELQKFHNQKFPCLENRKLIFLGASSS